MKSHRNILRSAGIVGSATALSRVLGFIRDVIIASAFGTSYVADAFFVAFRIPNLLRRLLGEGALSAAFIPVFTKIKTQKDDREAMRFAASAVNVLVILLVVVSIAGVLLAPALVRVLTLTFKGSDSKLALTVALTRWIFPYIFFAALAALFMGILNASGHFFFPALSPVCLNCALIGSVVLLGPRFSAGMESKVWTLVIGVLIGGLLQVLIQVPPAVSRGFRFIRKLFHPALYKVGRLMVPAIFGLAVTQVNILVDTMLAWHLGTGSVSALYYGNRLVQLPLGVIGIAIATASFPSFSRRVAEGDLGGLNRMIGFSVRMVMFWMVPATVGLLVLSKPIVTLLFERGAFDPSATEGTVLALVYYSIGLAAYAAVKVLVPVFYSLNDAKTPVRIGAVCVAINIVLNLLLMGPLAHGGLALATSLSSMVNATLLIWFLVKKWGVVPVKELVGCLLRVLLLSGIMGVMVVVIRSGLLSVLSSGALLVTVLVPVAGGAGLYFALGWILKYREIREIGKTSVNGGLS